MFKEEEQLFLIIAPEGGGLALQPTWVYLIHPFRHKILLRRLEDRILSNRRKGGSPNSTWLCRARILMLIIKSNLIDLKSQL